METTQDIQSRSQVIVRQGDTEVVLGGGAPVVIQAMTNTDTADITATTQQVQALAQAGAQMVRVTVDTAQAAAAVPYIRERLNMLSCSVPLIGDFHYNGHTLLNDFPDCAQALAKYRINPGNVGKGAKKDIQFAQIIEHACRYQKVVRIGVNWGSLDQTLLAQMMDANAQLATPKVPEQVLREALLVSALDSAQQAMDLGLSANQIVLSCKVSKVNDLVLLYQELAKRTPLALHLGLTEAGMGTDGIVASASALAILLRQGIGDTIRVSLTPRPDGDRTEEVKVAQSILQALELRFFTPTVTACPGCGRTTSTRFQTLAEQVKIYLEQQMPLWITQYPGVETMKVAVMGCIVNGPGESKHANIGISLPGSGEAPIAPVFIDGEKTDTLRGEDLVEQFTRIVERYVAQKYGVSHR